ncbi:hypothetical protein ACWC0A_22555 [Streptomyces scopuliridis]
MTDGYGCPRVVAVVAGQTPSLPWLVVDAAGREIEPVSNYLRDLLLGDVSPLTCRSHGFDLLRWHRVLWALDVGWDRRPMRRPPRWWAGSVRHATRNDNARRAVTGPVR